MVAILAGSQGRRAQFWKMATITKNRKFSKKSLKNYLLWNCWANWAQIMVKWSLDGPLSELYPTTLPAKEDGGHC